MERRSRWAEPAPREFICGLDLGQSADYSAVAVLERIKGRDEPESPVRITFQLRHLARWALHTAYPVIVADTAELLSRPPLSGETWLVADATGVGRPVLDLLWGAGLEPRAVTITAGSATTRDGSAYHVPKRDLVATLVTLLQTDRLAFAPRLPLADALAGELLNFRIKIDLRSGHDSYEHWRQGDHDDLVLATGLAAWFAESELPKLDPPDEATAAQLAGFLGDSWQPWTQGASWRDQQ